MGALLSQAVANQLRQYPGFQNPNPTPQTLLQQVLNPPGPSRPMWQAPLMENQRVLETSMDPTISAAQREAANRALQHQMLMTALAFGGADITKEQKAAWEAENAAYRLSRKGTAGHLPGYPEGTRVAFRPSGYANEPGQFGPRLREAHGVVVNPGTPEAGAPGYGAGVRWRKEPMSPDYVAVRPENGRFWQWRHRDDLEILPPLEEFPVGTKVEYGTVAPERYRPGTEQPWVQAEVSKPPAGSKPPGPDYVWVDYEARPDLGLRHPFGGGWYHKKDLVKKK